MKILHTSDWHLGQNFMGKSRYEEHKAFLSWLYETILHREIDVLLVSGDIFDTGTPPNYALELYYNFIRQLHESSCRMVVTAGNHDSIATLKAPRQLLEAMRVDLVTGEEIPEPIVIEKDGEAAGIVCAVPFLREGMVRKSLESSCVSEKERQLTEGIEHYYRTVCEAAEKVRAGRDIPIIGMGHLTTLGGKSSESEREIYVGGSLHIDSAFFVSLFDYTALGHLHKNQRVGEGVWYSGSPIPLSFSETGQKRVNIVTFEGRVPQVERVDIPLFRPLLSLRGKLHEVLEALENIGEKESWIEVHVDDDNPYEANRRIRQAAEEMGLQLLLVRLEQSVARLREHDVEAISLDELTPLEVFEKRLDADSSEDEQMREVLIRRFKEVVSEVQNDENP
ncbi:MAG: exonuclease sbcCD subunit D [Sulfurospirillum sp.]|nr:MAG: exonuclease sbcCD subunit D [Sulfurospirillum sp.]